MLKTILFAATTALITTAVNANDFAQYATGSTTVHRRIITIDADHNHTSEDQGTWLSDVQSIVGIKSDNDDLSGEIYQYAAIGQGENNSLRVIGDYSNGDFDINTANQVIGGKDVTLNGNLFTTSENASGQGHLEVDGKHVSVKELIIEQKVNDDGSQTLVITDVDFEGETR